MNKTYDIIIIGGGPAGLTAGLYAGRAKKTALIIESGNVGGQIKMTSEIENYPGCSDDESGSSLMQKFSNQVKKFGTDIVQDTVTQTMLIGSDKTVVCKNSVYTGRTVIIATGAHPIKLGCPGELEFTGKGVSYCAICDASFFEDLPVYVVGGGDAAIEEAMYLTNFASSVTVIHRRNELRAAKSIQEKAFANPKMNFIWNSTVKELKGEAGVLDTIILENVETKEEQVIEAGEDGLIGLFVFIGYKPNSELFQNELELTKDYIPAGEDTKTSIPGVYAAGDIRLKDFRQVITASADGAVAAMQASKYIEELR